jgi:Glycosyl transferase family 2
MSKSIPTIAYCIPVLNRADEIATTLPKNLEFLSTHSNIRIIVNCFDAFSYKAAMEASETIRRAYNSRAIVRQAGRLPYWHFCWAKNSFRDIIEDDYYSSLDGDNYLSSSDIEETTKTLTAYQDKGYAPLIHHFSGCWGDGTSGRITVPTVLYRRYGYNSRLFSRQFDEVGLIATLLASEKNTVFISRPGASMLEKSNLFRKFIDRAEVCQTRFREDYLSKLDNQALAPLNPKGEGYAERDRILNFYQHFNAAFSFYSASKGNTLLSDSQDKLIEETREVFSKNYGVVSCQSVFRELFWVQTKEPLTSSDQLTLYAVIKDDNDFLDGWYHHYKSLGVERFILIDDDSKTPLVNSINKPDVYVFKPRVGDFKTLKVKWIKALMIRYQAENSWVITVDSDELVDFVSSNSYEPTTATEIIPELEASGHWFAAGLLCEMLPAKNFTANAGEDHFFTSYSNVYSRLHCTSMDYSEIRSVKWAFGRYWPLSYMLDFRYRVFGTVDCIRKIPLFKYSESLELNQGYHAIRRDSRELSSEDTLASPILPVRHYKSYKYLSSSQSQALVKNANAYHARTAQNLRRQASHLSRYISAVQSSPFISTYNASELAQRISGYMRGGSPSFVFPHFEKQFTNYGIGVECSE